MERVKNPVIWLKTEYGTTLNCLLPYPGDWHILKNILSTKFHHGSTFRIMGLFQFCITHRLLLEAWEVLWRHQMKTFLSYISDYFIAFQNDFDNIISDIISTLDLTFGEDNICDRSLWSEICWKNYVYYYFVQKQCCSCSVSYNGKKTHPNRFVLVPRMELHRRLHLFINRSRKLIKFITYTVIYRGNSSEYAEIYYYKQFK